MAVKYGDIILVDLNPVKGDEISKIRPCLVVSRNILNEKSSFFIVVPFTGNVDRSLSWHVKVNASTHNGLSCDSEILPEQIKSIFQGRMIKKLGNLEMEFLLEVEQKLLFMLNQSDEF